jgi:L-fuconolactonase
MAPVIDSHQHFWNLDKVDYPWMSPVEYEPICRNFEADELEPQLRGAGVDGTVLVQSANSLEDTEYMLEVADERDWVRGVVGWTPLTDPVDAARSLDRFQAHPRLRGIRHLIHEEPDPDWLLQDRVTDSLRMLSERGLTFDVVAVLPRHLEHVPTIAARVPELKIVIDHLAKPPIADDAWDPWASLLGKAAEHPTVYAKVSGLNTAAGPGWNAATLDRYVAFAFECFGSERLMFGSDWPVLGLIDGDDYDRIVEETKRVLSPLSQSERDAIMGGTATAFYGLAADAPNLPGGA